MELEKFEPIEKIVIRLLDEMFRKTRNIVTDPIKTRQLDIALVNLNYHPHVPSVDTSLSFSYENVTFYVFYGIEKIEFSEYASEDTGFGHDHCEICKFSYFTNGTKEEDGDLWKFEEEIFSALNYVDSEEVSVTDEE